MSAVLQVTPELDAGGVERTTLEVAEALVAAGHRALVASAGGRLEPELRALGGQLSKMPLASKNPFVLISNGLGLVRLCRTQGVNLIHARSRAPAWSALWAARRLKLPFVTTYHGIYNAKSRAKRFYNSVMARGDVVIANSKFTARHLIAEHGVPPERVVTIYRGVDLAAFDPAAVSEARRAAVRALWHRDDDVGKLIVLAPARLTRWKGQTVMLRALAEVVAERPGRIKLILAGDPQGRRAFAVELETLIRKHILADAAVLVGHVSDMPAALACADVALFASLDPEAFGRGAAEAQAMGLPVVVSAHGGFTETVLHDETGWHVEPGEVEALAATLLRIIDMDRDRLRSVGQAAAVRARALYSKTALQQATLEVYQRLLAQGRGKG